VGGLGFWQNQDLVYRLTAQNVMGKWDLPVFWYPVGLGLVGLLALFGWRQMCRTNSPLKVPLAAWTLPVIALHTSPVLNGFHFVFHLPLPICIAAAPILRQFWETCRENLGGSLMKAGLASGLFISTLYGTYASSTKSLSFQISADSLSVITHLKKLPRGNVWASPVLSNLIPAYSGHRVYAGHWFLTPYWPVRQPEYRSFIKGEYRSGELTKLLQNEKIRYAILPKDANPAVTQEVAALSENQESFGEYLFFVLRPKRTS
jgi:hypothetical protein